MIISRYILIFLLILTACSNQENPTTTENPGDKTEQEIMAENNWKETNSYESPQKTEDNIKTDTENRNNPPKIEKISVEMLSNNPRDGFRAVVSAVDPEGDDVEFIYQWKYNDEDLIGETEQVLPWKEEFEKGNKISIEVIPYDYEVEGIWKSEGSFIIPNSPPLIESTPPGELIDGMFEYTIRASDPDGDNISYNISNAPQGMTFNEETKTLEWNVKNADSGSYNMEINISDDDGATTTQIIDLSVNKQES